MNEPELRALVARNESAQIEFKRTTGSLQAGVRSVCALLNGALPGWVIFGARDDGHLDGQEVSSRTLEDIAQELRRIEPPAFPDIDVVPLSVGRSAVVLRVPGSTGLFMYDGRPFHCVGPTTSVMPIALYERRLMERLQMGRGARWRLKGA